MTPYEQLTVLVFIAGIFTGAAFGVVLMIIADYKTSKKIKESFRQLRTLNTVTKL